MACFSTALERGGTARDLAIRDGRIAAIGANLANDAAKVIDAHGLAVAPGFIDIKTHSDFTLPINPKAESKLRQGVTTEIIGHCGFSVAPACRGRSNYSGCLTLARRGCRFARRRFRRTSTTFRRPR